MIRFNYRADGWSAALIVLVAIAVILLNLAIGFGITCLCTWLACMCFGFNWTVQFAAGIFFIMIILWWFVSMGTFSNND